LEQISLIRRNALFKRIALAGLMVFAVFLPIHAQKLTGVGATFPYPIYTKWFSEYAKSHSGVVINYQPLGSGAGIRQVSAGLVDFAASDEPMTDYQMASSRIKVLQIPAVLGAVVPVFHLAGVSKLQFSPEVLSGIYLGRIRKWNDSQLATDNPGVALPDQNIVVVYRSDASGTSYIFTDYLSKVSKEWAKGPGRSISPAWPRGAGARANQGVAAMVHQIPGAIGYVELNYAIQSKLSLGTVRNAAGHWVDASVQTVTQAAGSIGKIPADFRISITDAPGDEAYPISSFTWLLVPVRATDAAKGKALRDLVAWVVTNGQAEAGALSYAPLPSPVVQKVLAAISSLR
jgi:phosphate transport system substrate-binding protein